MIKIKNNNRYNRYNKYSYINNNKYFINRRNYKELLLIDLALAIVAVALFIVSTIMISNIQRLNKRVNLLNAEVNLLSDEYVVLSRDVQDTRTELINLENDTVRISTIEEILEEETSNRWNIKLTEEERELLAKIVYLEAGNQSQEGQMAVVEVIFNRMIDENYQGTLEEVLSTPGQFSTWENRHISNPTEEIYESIDMVLNGQSDILSYEVLYFATTANGRTIVKEIEDHVFCK